MPACDKWLKEKVETEKNFKYHPHSTFENYFSGEIIHSGLDRKDLVVPSIVGGTGSLHILLHIIYTEKN